MTDNLLTTYPAWRRWLSQVSATNVILTVVVALIALFLIAPLIVVALSSVTASGYLTFPPEGLSLRWYGQALENPGFVSSFWTSAQLAAIVMTIDVVVSVPAAYAITRYRSRTTRALEEMFLSPLILPAVVLGVGLLFALSSVGRSGTFEGALLAHVVIASPFVIRSVLAGFKRTDVHLEEASRALGAGPVRTFFRVVVPSVYGSIASGAVFAFIISFDEAVATMFLTGSEFTTLPVKIFSYVQYSNDPSVAAASTILVLLSVVMVSLVMWLSNAEDRRERRIHRT